MVKHITEKELETLITESELPVFCDFWANWCGPCRMLAPVYEEISDQYDGKAVFVKMDIDENESAAVKYGITSIPNILVFKKGQPVDSNLGFVPAAVLESFVKNNL